jgi:hypothetical protein
MATAFHPEKLLSGNGKRGGVTTRGSSPVSALHHLVTWPLTLHLVARVHTNGGLPDPSQEGVQIDKAYLYRISEHIRGQRRCGHGFSQPR